MIENLEKEINILKNNIDTLPKDNESNLEKYYDYVKLIHQNYSYKMDVVNMELDKKYLALLPNNTDKKIETQKEIVDSFKTDILFNDYKTSYEKMGIDKYLYDIGHFYKNDLDKVNEDILLCIKTFREYGLEKMEFNYSPYCQTYMDILLDNPDNKEKIRDAFDKIYWKCPEIVTHIELNLKNIYMKNKKMFAEKLKRKENDYFISQNSNKKRLKENYFEAVKEYDRLVRFDKTTLVNLFRDKTLNIKDYKNDSIKNAYNFLKSEDAEIDDYLNSNIAKLGYSLIEYQNYNKYLYIINDLKKRYQEKDKYKGLYEEKLSEVNNAEKKLFNMNKEIASLKKKRKLFMSEEKRKGRIIELSSSVDDVVIDLKQKYDDLEDARVNNQIYNNLNEDSTIKDALLLAVSNYDYIISMITKEINSDNDELIKEEINNLQEMLFSPYNTIINNLCITDDKSVPYIISDGYGLLKLKVTKDMLENENTINTLLTNIEIVNNSIALLENALSIDDIEFICKMDEIKKYKLY